jgi:hypothetical protein
VGFTLTLLPSSGRPEPPQARAEQWFHNPIQAITVTTIGQFSPSADGACRVEFDRGAVGYVKPRQDAAKNPVVAREKIAFDLGFLLGLPVAPVVVRSPDPPAWPYHSALSLEASTAARLWGAGGCDLSTAGKHLEELRVFWTWIGDQDHNGHAGNLLFTVRSGRSEVISIDHSYSLCHGNKTDPLQVGVCQGYGTAAMPDAPAWRAAVLAKINALEWPTIEHIVRRLEPILDKGEQDTIIKIIKARRDHLATLLGQ